MLERERGGERVECREDERTVEGISNYGSVKHKRDEE
jgi:hypothetical protein